MFYQSEFEYSGDSKLNILLKILIITIVFSSGLFIGWKMKKLEKGKKSSSNRGFEKKNDIQYFPVSQKNQTSKQYEDLVNENTALREEISQLQAYKYKQDASRIDLNPQVSIDQVYKAPENQVKSPDQNFIIQTISVFFQYPEGDGSFKKDFGTFAKDNNSFFEIIYKENYQEGELKFVAEKSSYGKILTLRDTSLRPVCEIENSGVVEKPTNISVIKNGLVEIKEDRFIIKEGHKLKIKIS
ncbi:hypothetical protein [Algoriphagus persicinus]|uniref:hypothetical protein n=1 Tax=Algoriphagus persicinus TaxID=3108754 RepID=UPI002B3E58A1|nr:hypothetical protein [Algoriphagus sp. E1-3-M2]MEB2787326.1 hypothetical protein [Algoriphagus sp. E1-3-M2]